MLQTEATKRNTSLAGCHPRQVNCDNDDYGHENKCDEETFIQ